MITLNVVPGQAHGRQVNITRDDVAIPLVGWRCRAFIWLGAVGASECMPLLVAIPYIGFSHVFIYMNAEMTNRLSAATYSGDCILYPPMGDPVRVDLLQVVVSQNPLLACIHDV